MPTLVNCPTCNRKLRIPEELLGRKVKCPGCQGTFTAQAEEPPPPPGEEPPSPRASDDPRAEGLSPQPPPPPPPEEFSEEPPRRRSRRMDEGFPEDEGDEERQRDRPSRRRRGGGDYAEAHRGGLILTLGIISAALSAIGVLLACCWIGGIFAPIGIGLGIPAWIMGQKDRGKMQAGIMDPSGRGATTGGWVCGIIGVILGIVALLCVAAVVVINIAGVAFDPNKM